NLVAGSSRVVAWSSPGRRLDVACVLLRRLSPAFPLPPCGIYHAGPARERGRSVGCSNPGVRCGAERNGCRPALLRPEQRPRAGAWRCGGRRSPPFNRHGQRRAPRPAGRGGVRNAELLRGGFGREERWRPASRDGSVRRVGEGQPPAHPGGWRKRGFPETGPRQFPPSRHSRSFGIAVYRPGPACEHGVRGHAPGARCAGAELLAWRAGGRELRRVVPWDPASWGNAWRKFGGGGGRGRRGDAGGARGRVAARAGRGGCRRPPRLARCSAREHCGGRGGAPLLRLL
ncbi:hypothetical protein T484DRAFT_1918002, partial [Baffinella frigidus]